jgi:hypothetical protein
MKSLCLRIVSASKIRLGPEGEMHRWLKSPSLTLLRPITTKFDHPRAPKNQMIKRCPHIR